MNDNHTLNALVIYESFFGNTASIARAIAGGLRLEDVSTTVLCVAEADNVELDDYHMLVVGGPTHAFALSRPSTRKEAIARGGDRSCSTQGLREWLSVLPTRPGTHLAATFDTRVSKVRHLPMSAGRSAAHILRQRGFTLVKRPAGFVVQDVEGPLESREMERAIWWGRSVAREAQGQIEARRDLSPR